MTRPLFRTESQVARANARLNGVSPLVECICAKGLTGLRFRQAGPFDLVFANILLPPLKALNELLVLTQPAHLTRRAGRELGPLL